MCLRFGLVKSIQNNFLFFLQLLCSARAGTERWPTRKQARYVSSNAFNKTHMSCSFVTCKTRAGRNLQSSFNIDLSHKSHETTCEVESDDHVNAKQTKGSDIAFYYWAEHNLFFWCAVSTKNSDSSPFQGSGTIKETSSNYKYLNLIALCITFTRINKHETWHSGSISCNVRASLSLRHLEEPVRLRALTLAASSYYLRGVECSVKKEVALQFGSTLFQLRIKKFLSSQSRLARLTGTNPQLCESLIPTLCGEQWPTHTSGRTNVKSHKESLMQKQALCALWD